MKGRLFFPNDSQWWDKVDNIRDLIKKYENNKIAVYGLGTETERFLSEHEGCLSVEGLLDGFREDGIMYGYPIIPLSDTVIRNIRLIIVVARPGSCKAIAKRIGDFCRRNEIALFDVRGKDLLAVNNVAFDFSGIKGVSRNKLYEMIRSAKVVSFDLFDTLITRRVLSYTDIFDLMDIRLREMGVVIPDFSRLRLYAEKELSKRTAPGLKDIYSFVLKKTGGNFISAEELASMEFNLDLNTITVRKDVRELFENTISSEKEVVITTDSYYTLSQIELILDKAEIDKPDHIYVSCEYGTSKNQNLYDIIRSEYEGKGIIHIGDDEFSDILKASEYGISTYRVYSALDLYDALGGLGLEECIKTLSDRIKTGMFIAEIFNSPFCFEDEAEKLSINNAGQLGYLFCAPMITDFVLWMKQKAAEEGYRQILFCARDGYLPGKLFREVSQDTRAVYFLSSRTAAIRAGMEDEADIEYVAGMKYFGTPEEALKTRFGIAAAYATESERSKAILLKSEIQRKNYKKYIEKLDLNDGSLAMFDFVAKGTTQMCLGKLFSQHIKGFYFLQLEPEFMAGKGLDIEPFYTDEEKNTSAIFDNYYILETMLTSPYSQLEEFDEKGEPVFAVETRSEKDLAVFERAQAGITEYFEEYMRILPEKVRTENKKLDERMLAFVNRVQIRDEDFLSLKVEDPFFGRMTNIRDVIG